MNVAKISQQEGGTVTICDATVNENINATFDGGVELWLKLYLLLFNFQDFLWMAQVLVSQFQNEESIYARQCCYRCHTYDFFESKVFTGEKIGEWSPWSPYLNSIEKKLWRWNYMKVSTTMNNITFTHDYKQLKSPYLNLKLLN